VTATDHARYADDPGAYLLGALGEHERQAFEAHLAVCAECRQEVDRLRPAAEALPRSVTPLAAPPTLKRSLMEVVEQEAAERRPARVRRPLRQRLTDLVPSFAGARPAVAWVSAAVLLAIGIAGGVGIGQLVSGEDEARTVSASVDRSRVPNGSASLVVPAGGRDGAILRVHGLPRLGPKRVYQVWVQRGHEVIPGPTFLPRADGSGAAAVPDSVDDADAVMVTREARGGAPAPGEDPIVRVRI
jgi:anti-sigma-K factor RskA/putative zinc finger protein